MIHIIKSVTVYTDDYFRALSKYEKKYTIRRIVTFAFAIIITLANLKHAFYLVKIPENMYYGICLIGVSLILISYIVENIIHHLVDKKKTKKDFFNTLIRYYFDEDEFSFEMDAENFHLKRKYKYNDIFSIIETENYFLIYPQKNMVLITGKNDITDGNAPELKNLLSDKTGKKYKRKLLI